MLQDSYQKVLPMKYPNREGYFIGSRNHHHMCPTHIQRSEHCLPLYSFVHQTNGFLFYKAHRCFGAYFCAVDLICQTTITE